MAGRDLRTDAVVLRRVPYGDADLILTLYTRARGRLSALARSARRSTKRFGPAIDLFSHANVALVERPGSELFTMREASLVSSYALIARDIGALAHGSYGTELVRELSPVEQPDVEVLDLLLELYQLLASHPPTAHGLRAFELRLLHILGVAPVLDRCAGCGAAETASRGWVIDPSRGGVVCRRCAIGARGLGVRPISADARAVLLHAQAALSLADAAAAPILPAAAEARDALLATILSHVGKPLRSLEFLTKLSASRSRLPEIS